MFTIFSLKLAVTVVTLLVIVLSVWSTLRLLDKLLGVKFSELFNIIKQSPVALAIYLGLRLLAVFLCCGIVLCLAFVF